MTKKTVSPIRPPDSLAAVTVEMRGINKKLAGIVEHLNTGGKISNRADELRQALSEHKTAIGRFNAAMSRITDL